MSDNEFSLKEKKENLTDSQYHWLNIICFDGEKYYFEGQNKQGVVIFYKEYNTPKFGEKFFKYVLGKRGKLTTIWIPAEGNKERIFSLPILMP